MFNICVLFNHIEHTYSIEHNMVYYQKVVILPVLVTTYLPYPFILPWFSLANLVLPTRPSSTALPLTGYFISDIPTFSLYLFVKHDYTTSSYQQCPHDDFGVYRFFSHLFTAMDCIFHHIL